MPPPFNAKTSYAVAETYMPYIMHIYIYALYMVCFCLIEASAAFVTAVQRPLPVRIATDELNLPGSLRR